MRAASPNIITIRGGGRLRSRGRNFRAGEFRGRGFSLIEVLLAIFILGIGVISIAALFPAGIALQRQAGDDIMGPIVANNAMAIIRSKVQPEDFGTFEEFGVFTTSTPRPTIAGDWPWLRPGFVFEDDMDTETSPPPPAAAAVMDDSGSVDLFSWYAGSSAAPTLNHATEFPGGYPQDDTMFPLLYGIPFNTTMYGPEPPAIAIRQSERFYPASTQTFSTEPFVARPQYVWDCMFRRFQGRILVAVFVYRVNVPGGSSFTYRVQPNPSFPDLPPLPVWLELNLDPPPPYCASGAWDSFGLNWFDAGQLTPENDAIILGTAPDVAYTPTADMTHAWQEPGQWILDQNNNIHRVLSNERDSLSVPVTVELVRPAPAIAVLNQGNGDPYYYDNSPPIVAAGTVGLENIVTDIWYIPLQIQVDANSDGTPDTWVSLTPVYVTVQEL